MSDIKITKERIDALLGEADIRTLTLFGKCTVVTAKLKNGFILTADSACVDPANYDKRKGERICLEHIANKLWELEGYRLQWDVFNKANRKGTAPGLDGDAPYGGLDLYLIPKDPSLYAKPSLVNLVKSTNLFNIWQRSEHAQDQPLPRFDWSKLEYPRFGPFKFYIGSHLGWSKEDSTDEQS